MNASMEKFPQNQNKTEKKPAKPQILKEKSTKEPKELPRIVARRTPKRSFLKMLGLLGVFIGTISASDALSSGKSPYDSESDKRIAPVSDQMEADSPETHHAEIVYGDQTFSWNEFDRLTRLAMEEYLGPELMEPCEDAEQCFYYYADQLDADPAPIELLSGRTADELKWNKNVLRKGFYEQPGMRLPGTYVGVVEVGRDVLPTMTQDEINNFYRECYELELTRASDAYQDFRVIELNGKIRRELRRQMREVVRTETVLAAWSVKISKLSDSWDDFEEWFELGISGSESGETQWQEAFDNHSNALKQLYEFGVNHPAPDMDSVALEMQGAMKHTRAVQAHVTERLEFFKKRFKAAKAKTFGGDEADYWQEKVTAEKEKLTSVDTEISSLHQKASELNRT